MKLAVIGSRSFKNQNRLFLEIDELRKIRKAFKKEDVTEIVSGGAQGADKMGEEYADEKFLKKKIFLADWSNMEEPCIKRINSFGKEYNALAGFNRNTKIIDYCDEVIAFWDGTSPGTKDSIDKAQKLGKKVKIVKI